MGWHHKNPWVGGRRRTSPQEPYVGRATLKDSRRYAEEGQPKELYRCAGNHKTSRGEREGRVVLGFTALLFFFTRV